jgi:hypothetical protein
MLELRERAEASDITPSSPSQLDDLGTFHTTIEFVRRTINEDFGESLYPVGTEMDPINGDNNPYTGKDEPKSREV